jgi:predicted MFS family arabinose efflux permease
MITSHEPRMSTGQRRALPALMFCTMTAQALLVVLTVSLASVAAELDAEPVAVSQARTVTAAVALACALVLLVKVTSLGVRRIAVGGAVLTLAATVAVSTAGNLAHFLAAHVLVGMAVAAMLTAGYAGLAGMPQSLRRASAGWVTAAAGIAWVLGTPLIGGLSEHLSWRVAAFFPVLTALGALVLSRTLSAPSDRVIREGALSSLIGRAGARRWTIAETLAHISWASVLTFVGALFVIGLGVGDAVTGWLLSVGAACFVVTSVAGRRIGSRMDLRKLVAVLTVLLAVAVLILFGTALLAAPAWQVGDASAGAQQPAAVPEAAAAALATLAFAGTAALAGLRIPASATLGMAQLPERPDVMMAARTLCQQIGYLVGSALSGATVAVAGWAALGPVLAIVLLASAWAVLRLTPFSAPPAAAPDTRAAGES